MQRKKGLHVIAKSHVRLFMDGRNKVFAFDETGRCKPRGANEQFFKENKHWTMSVEDHMQKIEVKAIPVLEKIKSGKSGINFRESKLLLIYHRMWWARSMMAKDKIAYHKFEGVEPNFFTPSEYKSLHNKEIGYVDEKGMPGVFFRSQKYILYGDWHKANYSPSSLIILKAEGDERFICPVHASPRLYLPVSNNRCVIDSGLFKYLDGIYGKGLVNVLNGFSKCFGGGYFY